MIELFDAERLLPRRDASLPVAALLLAMAVGGLGTYAGHLQQALRSETARKVALEGHVRQAQALATKAPSAALLADLQRELGLAEAEDELARGKVETRLAPSAWLERLAALASADVSLTRVEVDVLGRTQVEGMAVNAQAVSGFVQAFSRQEAVAGLAPRSVELRQDKTSAPHLRFQMNAALPAVAATPAAGPTTVARAGGKP
jgi:hypothetical protein